MRTITDEELKEILAEHELWLISGRTKGERANLCMANLEGENLRGADLR
ncbi:MAG: pentapeptide repeat-containing protein, partial [Gammaproteobacteria bacterium]|nr:pentapeptide repeat-containing protein [Gammaproteobacteria bacterium]